MSGGRRFAIFIALLVICSVGAVVAIISAINGSRTEAGASPEARRALVTARSEGQSVVVFRSLSRGKAAGQLAVAPVGAGKRTLEPLNCERAYFAASRGVCVAPAKGFAAGYRVRVIDPSFRVLHDINLPGIPSRARVSPDGRMGAVTFFVAGHAYAEVGSFSTQTTLLDLVTGKPIADLEDFTVSNGDRQVTAVDVNFWGVTFARDGDTFFATLATAGKTYLIRGSVRSRAARVIHENVECPSLSPDGKRITYKRREPGGGARWRLTILDLATMRETPTAETRSVDDQAEWLDDGSVLYGIDGGIWRVAADGSGAPHRYIGEGDSPAVVNWSTSAD
jgi:hypothetical protein